MSTTKTFEHTFADTGITVVMRKVSPFLIQEARTRMMGLRPTPPVRTVTEEGPLFGTTETMEHDPDYIAEVKRWEENLDRQVMEFQISRGIVEIKASNWQDDVVELRETFKSMGIGDTLPTNDMVCYITYIASGTPDDLQEFVQSLATRSQPTQGAIEAAKDSFRANVPAQERVGRKN